MKKAPKPTAAERAAIREERERTIDLNRNPCFQCDLEIPHVRCHGIRGARWGLD